MQNRLQGTPDIQYQKKRVENGGPATNRYVGILANVRHRRSKKPQQHWRTLCFLQWMSLLFTKGKGFLEGGNKFYSKGKVLHNDSLSLWRIRKKRPMLQGRTLGSNHGARGASEGAWGTVHWTHWGSDPGSGGVAGPSGRRSLIGWPCGAREAPVRCGWRQWFYLDRHKIERVSLD